MFSKIRDLFKRKSKQIYKFFIDRFSEPSSWRGIILLLTAAGITIEPDLQEAILTFGLMLAGLIGVLSIDTSKDNNIDSE